jgi:hypothetical protein
VEALDGVGRVEPPEQKLLVRMLRLGLLWTAEMGWATA